MIQQFELSLGATLLVEQIEQTGTAALGFWYSHGSRDESFGERGCSHLLEHMVFKGTRSRSAVQIAREIDRVGGAINAFTDRETTCLYCSVPAAAAPIAAEVLTDLATAAIIDATDFAKERQVVINEIHAAEDSPDERAFQAYVERLWGKHALSRRIAGEVEEVEGIDRGQLIRFYHERFHPSRLVISIAGSVAVGEVIAVIDSALRRSTGIWPDDESLISKPRALPTHHSGMWQEHDDCHQTYLYGGRMLPVEHNERNYYALTLFNTLVGESMSSRLFQKLREDRGLCYSVGSFRIHLSDIWLWSVFANCVPEARVELTEALLSELGELRDTPPSKEEVTDAASHLRGSLIFAREDMETRMRRMVYQRQTFGRVLSFEEMDMYIDHVSPEELVTLAELVADNEALTLVAYGSDPIEHNVDSRPTG